MIQRCGSVMYCDWLHTHVHVYIFSEVEYRYYVHRVPYVEYSSKQVDPLMERDEVLNDVGVHQAKWRLLRKRYSIRVEFEQGGSLGKRCIHIIGMLAQRPFVGQFPSMWVQKPSKRL